jgi:hypothetical protein
MGAPVAAIIDGPDASGSSPLFHGHQLERKDEEKGMVRRSLRSSRDAIEMVRSELAFTARRLGFDGFAVAHGNYIPDVWFVGYRQHVILAWLRCSPRAQAFISVGEALPFPPDTDDNCSLLSSIVAASDEAWTLWALFRRLMLRRSMMVPPVQDIRTVVPIAAPNRDEDHVHDRRRPHDRPAGPRRTPTCRPSVDWSRQIA